MSLPLKQATLFDGRPELSLVPTPPKVEPAPAPVPKVVAKAPKKAPKPKGLARGEFEPINPPNLAQESAVWLTGQRSIAEQRGKRYVPASVKHPGKMQPDVAGAIIDTYTAPEDHIVDFMGGICTTGVEGAERGRHVTVIELVRHWANVAYANACRTMLRGAPGSIRVIRGDARNLVALLNGAGADAVVTSPPYGEALEPRRGRVENRMERLQQLLADGQKLRGNWHFGPGQRAMMAPAYQADAVLTSPVYGESRIGAPPSGVCFQVRGGLDVSNLPRGYDAALISPPYGDTNLDPGLTTGLHFGRDPEDVAVKKARQGKTQQGYDAAVVSPPYGPAEGNGGGRGLEAPAPKEGEWADYEKGTGPSPGWRGYGSRAYAPVNADAVITSPAYGDIRQDGGAHQFGDNSAMDNYTSEARVKSRAQRDQSNVGNKRYGTMDKALALIDRLKRGETIPEAEWPGLCYLEDMALIYWGALQVLKPGGLIILVLKDYRRDKRRVNLVGDTMRLLEAIGFIYHDRALALTSKIDGGEVIAKVSPFVRVNARKPEKNGGKVLLPAGEEVLVFRKE